MLIFYYSTLTFCDFTARETEKNKTKHTQTHIYTRGRPTRDLVQQQHRSARQDGDRMGTGWGHVVYLTF